MRLESLVAEWLELGRQDLASAEFLLSMRPMPLEVIGFHCQQAVEKHLKAFLVQQGIEPDRTHDLLFLLQSCLSIDPSLEDLKETCAKLTDFAVRSRYPLRRKLDEVDIGDCVAAASTAVEHIRSRLRPASKE